MNETSDGSSEPFLIQLKPLLQSVRNSMDAAKKLTTDELQKRDSSVREPETPSSAGRELGVACLQRVLKVYPRALYRQRSPGKILTYSALGSLFPDDLLDDLERLHLNHVAIDVVEHKEWVAFDDPYTEIVCIWLQLFYDAWCREQTQHEEDTVAIRNAGSFVDFIFKGEDFHTALKADFPDFYFSLRPRLPESFEVIFERFLTYVEKRAKEIANAQQEMGA